MERELPIRTYDIDFAGIVSNIVYVRWLEDLRLAMMEEAYSLPQAVADDVAPILLETHVTYEHPLTLQDRPVGRIWATAMSGVRWSIAAEILVGTTIHARAEQTGIFIRLSTRRPVPPPAPLVARFALPKDRAP